MPKIIAAEEFHAKPPIADILPDHFGPASWAWVWHSQRFEADQTIPNPKLLDTTFSVNTFVNHGRWSILCPWCKGSEYASRTEHRFLCTHCQNASNGSKWVPVQWPNQWRLIERILELRVDPTTQNWHVGEPIDNLITENEIHGIHTRTALDL